MDQAKQEIDRHDLITTIGFSFGFFLFLWGFELLDGPRLLVGVTGLVVTLFAIWRSDRFRNLGTLVFVFWAVFTVLSKNTGKIIIEDGALKAWLLTWWWILPAVAIGYFTWIATEKGRDNAVVAQGSFDVIKTIIAVSLFTWLLMGSGEKSGAKVIADVWNELARQEKFIALVAFFAAGIGTFSKQQVKSWAALLFLASAIVLVSDDYRQDTIKFIGSFLNGIIEILQGVARKIVESR